MEKDCLARARQRAGLLSTAAFSLPLFILPVLLSESAVGEDRARELSPEAITDASMTPLTQQSGALTLQAVTPTQQYSHGDPTPAEQLMLEVINRARANPTAEAARYSIDLNEGLAPGTISAAPKRPLAFN